jgi:hypothetical protein
MRAGTVQTPQYTAAARDGHQFLNQDGAVSGGRQPNARVHVVTAKEQIKYDLYITFEFPLPRGHRAAPNCKKIS